MSKKEEPKKDEQKKEEEKKPELKMEYRKLGGTGLMVSCLGFGMMSIDSVKQCKELLKACRPNANGINFFDNAELYGQPVGNAETIFGKALKECQKEDPKLWRRSDLVITTKLFWGEGNGKIENSPLAFAGIGFGPNEMGLGRKHLMEGMNASLKRLQLDYVDIVMAHRLDKNTSVLEIVEGFTDIVNKGQALYWGTSTWPCHKIIEAYWLAKVHNLIPPVVEQPLYNMFNRDWMERLYEPLFEKPYNLGTTTYMPLDGGYLTGKYCNGIPKGSRFDKDEKTGNRLSKWWSSLSQDKIEKSKTLLKLAKEMDVSLVQLALAWCLKNKNVSVMLLGGTKAYQIEQNLGCIALAAKLTKEQMDKIEKVLGNKPKSDYGRSTFGAMAVKKVIETWN